MGNTADPIAVKTLINGIVEYNPSFAKANKPLLDDTVRLSQNPALVQRIIFAAIFAPLGAFSLDFNSAIDIDHSSWEGFHYLGDKIWLVSPSEGLRHENLNIFFGVGLKPTIDYVAFGANVIKPFLKKRPENMDATERNNAIQWAQIMGQAYEQRNRWILMQMLKDYTFYRRRSHEEGFPPEPFARDVAMVITKNNSRFSWDKYSRTAPAFVNARLSGWIQGLVFLLENDNPYLGHLFTKAQLHSISLERKKNGGPMDALGDIMGTVDFSPVEDLIRKRDDKRAIQKAISLIKALQKENFLTFEERHQFVYGKSPGNRPEHAIVTKDGADSLAVIPPAPTQKDKPFVSQTLSPGAPISLPQASPSAATENSMTDTGEVVNAQSPPPLLGPLESLETIGQIRGAIATLNDADRRGDSDMGLETIQELRVRLLQMVRESDNPAAELKTNGEALGLNSDEKLFLERYLEQQKKGLNPSFGYVVDGMNDDGEQNMLDAYARLVNLVGKVDYLPLSFDEDVEDVSDAEMSEGGLAPFYSKGYRVVVYKEHFEKNVANNNLVQKAIVNVVGNLVNRRETGESDMVIDSRGGLYARGVHKKTSSGQKVFIKIVGEKTIVVFWVGSEDKAHGRQSFSANKEVDRRIASQVDKLPNELDKYVAVGADFSVDETAELSKLLQNPQTGNGGSASTGGKATSLWLLKIFEFVGSFKGEGGREAFGEYYAENAPKIEPWVGVIVTVVSGFAGLLMGGNVGLGSTSVGGVAGMLFFLSHWIPESIKPVTEVHVSLPKAFLLAVLYGTLMAVSPQTFINLANDFSLIAAISFLGTFVVWYLTFRLHAWFDGKDGKTTKRTKTYYPDRIIGAKSYPSERGDRSVRQSAAVLFQYFLNKLAELQNENGHSERNFSFKNFEQWSYKHPPQVPKNLGNLILMIHGELMRTFPDYKRRFSEKWGRGKGIKPHDVLVFWSRNQQMSLTRPAENPDDDLTGTTIDLNNANRLRIAKRIGGGAYGIAFLATDALDKSYLVKTVNHPHPRMPLTTALGDIAFILHEGNILNRVSGAASGSGADSLPPVPRFYGYSLTRGAKIAIVSEFIEGTSLHDVVFNAEDPNHLNFEMAADIVDVVDRLHELGIVHGDIKADNIIIDANNQPRLIDFGSALQYRDSQGYVSNEKLNSDLASLASDQAWNHYGLVFSKSDFDFYRLWLMFDSTLPFFKDLSPLLKEISTEPERLLERARVLSDPFQRDVFQLWENLRSRYFSDVLLPRNLSSSQKARAVKDWLNVAEIRIMNFRNEQIDRRIRAKPTFQSAQTGSLSNSLLYLWSGCPGIGGVGAGVEGLALLWVASVLGGVGMGFFLLPLFSLAHVWIIARQNPGMSVAQLVQQFVWHYLLALPYALIGFSSVQEILGGENAAQFFAASWHLLTDAVFMIHDKISARKAAQRTMDTLLPPAGSLRIEQVGGARWTQDVRPQLFRPGFARAYEKALARELSQRWRGSLTTSPDGLVEWLESSFSGTPATADGQKVYVQAVAGEDLDDVLRSAQIVNGWVDRGLDAPRLVLAAKDTAVLAKLRAVARPGVVDVVEKPVTDPNGALDAALLLDSLNRFQISPSARLSVMVSASISVNEAVLDQLNGDLADQLREALLAIIKGDPIRHRDFRTVLEVATKVLESA